MKNILKNWKTTASALLLLALVGLFFFGLIDESVFGQVMAILVALGLINSADADKLRGL